MATTEAQRAAMRAYYQANKERIRAQQRAGQAAYKEANRDSINEKAREAYARDKEKYVAARKADPVKFMLKSAKKRAKEQGVPFALSPDDVHMPETCPILGVKLEVGEGAVQNCSPSLDKIVPELGYVPGNVRVISYLANAMKRDATVEQCLTFARNIAAYLQGE